MPERGRACTCPQSVAPGEFGPHDNKHSMEITLKQTKRIAVLAES